MFYGHFKYPVIMFTVIGVWPLKMKNKSLSVKIMRCLDSLAIFFVVTLTVSMFLEIPHAYEIGVNDMVSNIMLGCQFVIGIIRCWTLRLPATKYLIQRMLVSERNIFEGNSENAKSLLMKHLKWTNKLQHLYMLAAAINSLIFDTTPFLVKLTYPESDLRLPLDSWLPFNKNEHYMVPSYIWNVLAGLYITFYIIASDLAYLCLIFFSINQLEILKSEILYGINNKEFSNQEVHQNLCNIIVYYKNIRKFVTDLNNTIKLLILFEFVIHIVHIAMVGFSLMAEDFSFQLVKTIWYFLCSVFGELTMLYWFGNELFLQNSEISDAIWDSDWYNCNISNKKTILILMLEAQQPLRLDVGYSQHLSVETLLMILRSSCSYMITLKQFVAMKTTN